jgi:poly-gamma-glutamate synthesis protein (capsule biosynthesis protein)
MPSPITVVVTGQSLIHHDIRYACDPGFDHVVQALKRADIAFTNFESSIYGRHAGWPLKGSYFGCSEPVVLDALQAIGFNALALANNHAFDLGPSGILSTLEEVGARGFLHAGIGIDKAAALRPGTGVLGGRDFALVAMDAGPGPATMYADDARGGRPARPGVNRLDVARVFEVDPHSFRTLEGIQATFQSSVLERANYSQPHDPPLLRDAADIDFWGTTFRRSHAPHRRIIVDEASAGEQLDAIALAAAHGAFVIAYLHHHHWEPDWREVPEWVRVFAHRCIDAGARAFVSHGAPVLQPIEIHAGAPLFYGLGNFFFHLEEGKSEWSPPEVWKSVVASCVFNSEGQLQSIDLLPVVLGGEAGLDDDNFHERRLPIAATGAVGRSIIDDLRLRSAPFGTGIELDGHVGRIWLTERVAAAS